LKKYKKQIILETNNKRNPCIIPYEIKIDPRTEIKNMIVSIQKFEVFQIFFSNIGVYLLLNKLHFGSLTPFSATK
jgi:hypothetical protein